MFGRHGETSETVRETVRHLPRLEYSLLIYGFGVKILPGTEMCDVAMQEGLVNKEGQFHSVVDWTVLANVLSKTPNVHRL